MPEIKIKPAVYKWVVWEDYDRGMSLAVHGWGRETDFKWNIYLTVWKQDNFFYNSERRAQLLPWHGGMTYSQRITEEAVEVRWEHQKKLEYFKYGNDFQHYYDRLQDHDPKDGIPTQVMVNVSDIVQEIEEIYADMVDKM